MNKLYAAIFGAIVCASAFADTQVYRVELNTDTDIPLLVGQDGVRREVCIVDPAQYALMTGRLAKVWATFNATEDGRVKLHGKKSETVIDTNTLTKTTVYTDGFRHVESFEVRTPRKMEKFAGVKKQESEPITKKPAGMSDKRWEMRQAYIRRIKGKAKEITVHHDAVLGKDIVK